LTQTPVVWKSGGRWISVALLSGMTLSSGANASPANAGMAQVAPPRTWLTLDRPWLCRFWSVPSALTRHCTTRWHLDSRGQVVSDDPAWVPAGGVDDPIEVEPLWFYRGLDPRPYPRHAVVKPAVTPVVAPRHTMISAAVPARVSYGGTGGTGPYGLWTPPPGHPAYALPDYAGDPNAAYYGYCTWYAQYRQMGERLLNLGNAWQWAYNAPAHGLRVGTTPAVGATVVFQPGVEGAGGSGHVAHVEAVYGGGWFLISEMNMMWNGGGWGRVSYRYGLVEPGVSFIY
jgi:surface antigen